MPLDRSLTDTVSQLAETDREELLTFLQEQQQRPKRGRSEDEKESQEEGPLSKLARKDSSDSSDKNSTTSNSSQVIYATDSMITATINEGSFVNSRSTTPDQEHSSGAETDSSLNLVDISFQSNVTTVGDAKFNSQVLLTIDPTKINGQISILFTTERSSTSLGKTQGDHTLPERLLLEFIAKKIAGKTLEEISDTLHDNFRAVVENFDDPLVSNIPQKPVIIPYADSDDDIRRLGIRFKNASSVANYISEMIDRYNHLPLSVLPKDGHAAVGEGSKVSSNMNMLRAVDKFLGIATDIEGEISTQNADSFYKQAVLPNGSFTRGMKDFFGLGNIEEVRKRFPDTEEGKRDFIGVFQEKCNEETVGKILSEIFDFPYKDGLKGEKDSPRTQENLQTLTRRCTKMCLGSFPQISEKIDAMTLGKSLENQVMQKEVTFKSKESAITSSWEGKAHLQDWDSIFPLDKTEVIQALKEAKNIYSKVSDTPFSVVDIVNESFGRSGIKFQLSIEEESAKIYNLGIVIDKILQPLTEESPSITRYNLQTLITEKGQEFGQETLTISEERGGKS